MVRFVNWEISDNRAAGIAGIIFLLAVAGVFMVSRITQASPAGEALNNSGVIKQSDLSNTQTSRSTVNDNSSAAAEESLDDSSGQASSQTSTTTSVTVNGQNIPVPENGRVSQTLNTNNGTTTVNVDNQSSSTGSAGSSTNRTKSSVNVRVNSTERRSL